MFERKITRAPAPTADAQDDIGARVLRFLGREQLPSTPPNYTLGHLILSNGDGHAARAADAVTLTGARLSQTDADNILAAHGPKPELPEAERGEMRRQARQLAEIAGAALAETGAFGRALAAEDGLEGRIAALVSMMVQRTEEAESRLAIAAREVEALRQEVETARGDAARDALTGLLNRRGAIERLATLSPSGKTFVALCDIDRFKSVNDRYGHVVGDRVLKLVAGSLEQSFPGQVVARWGGEEFLIVLGGATMAEAGDAVDRARAALAERHVKLRATDEPLGPVTFSAGVAALGAARLDEAIRIADTLLYAAKAAGRNRVLTRDPAQDAASTQS